MVKIPEDYLAPAQKVAAAPAEIADAFVKANPGLTQASVTIACDAKRLTEVRICMSKGLKFLDCAEIEQHSCRRAHVVMPPLAHGEQGRRRGSLNRFKRFTHGVSPTARESVPLLFERALLLV